MQPAIFLFSHNWLPCEGSHTLAWQATALRVWLHQHVHRNIEDKSQGIEFAPVSFSPCSGLKYVDKHLFGAGSPSCPPRAAGTGASRAALRGAEVKERN